MANLLPIEEKNKIKKEYRMRLAVVAMFLLSGLIVVSIVLLAPSYILSSVKYKSATTRLEAEKKKISDSADGLDPIKIAKKVNANLKILGQESSMMPLSYDVFTTVVGHKPESVKIKSIFYDREKDAGRVSVVGVSKDRKTLLLFLQSLESEKMFNSVELPISSFVEGEDIEFTIRITIEVENEDMANTNGI